MFSYAVDKPEEVQRSRDQISCAADKSEERSRDQISCAADKPGERSHMVSICAGADVDLAILGAKSVGQVGSCLSFRSSLAEMASEVRSGVLHVL